MSIAHPGKREGRSMDELARAAPDADKLVAFMRHASPARRAEAAAIISVGWSRRYLLDVALELARRQAGIRRNPNNVGYVNRQRAATDARRAARQAERDAEEARWPDDAMLAAWVFRYRHEGDASAKALEAERVYRRRKRKAREAPAAVTVRHVEKEAGSDA